MSDITTSRSEQDEISARDSQLAVDVLGTIGTERNFDLMADDIIIESPYGSSLGMLDRFVGNKDAEMTDVRTIGILGVGRVGTALARQGMKSGFQVNIAGSGAPQDIELIVEFTARGATPMTATEVAAHSDLVVLATPLHRYRTLPASALAGKIVVDAMNYWVPANGMIPEFDGADQGTSEIVAEFLAGSRLVKSLNHIGYHDLEVHGRPPGALGRRALAVASDDAAAKATFAAVLGRFGYDTVDAGGLAAGRAFEPDTAIFDGVHTAEQLRGLLPIAPLLAA